MSAVETRNVWGWMNLKIGGFSQQGGFCYNCGIVSVHGFSEH
jgi:hypothetical protein